MKKIIVSSLIVLITSIMIFAVYYYNYRTTRVSETTVVSKNALFNNEDRKPPVGWLHYKNTNYYISIFYPDYLKASQRSEGEGTMSVTFQNPTLGKGFQIFVVPYYEKQISEERFKKDVPTGVRIDPKDIQVDGERAVAFYSKDLSLGETYEVWFIKNGFLYEVTTLKSLDTWLPDIISSWKFS